MNPHRFHQTHQNFFAMLTGFFIVIFGCTGTEPQSPKVDLSAKRADHSVHADSLVYPVGFPKEIGLYKSESIAEQDDAQLDPNHTNYGMVTWDTSATVDEIRDHYYQEFKKRDLSPAKFRVKMPGENFAVRFFDSKLNVMVTVSMGLQLNAGNTVHCFLNSEKSNQAAWEKMLESQMTAD